MGSRRRDVAFGSAVIAGLIAVIVWLGSERGADGPELSVDAPDADSAAMDLAPHARDTLDAPRADASVTPLDVPGAAAPVEGDDVLVLRFRVLDPDEVPVEDARVAIHEYVRDWQQTEPMDTALTDVEGRARFELAALPEPGLGVHISADGHVTLTSNGHDWADQENVFQLPWCARVSGVVRDAETGAPVAGAIVDDDQVTGSDGRFELECVSVGHEVYITARHPDYAAGSSNLLLHDPESAECDVLLQRGALVELTVADLRTDAPLAGVSLRDGKRSPPWGYTDAAGRCRLRVVPGEGLAVAFVADGFVPLSWRWNGEGAEALDRELRVRLRSQATVEGLVHDADGAPLPGVVVIADSERLPWAEIPVAVRTEQDVPGLVHELEETNLSTTDAEGLFRLEVNPYDGTYEVLAFHREYVAATSRPLELPEPGDQAWVELVLLRGGSVVVTVTRRGEPFDDAKLACRDLGGELIAYPRSQGEGRYRIDNVPVGEVVLELRAARRPELLARATVTVEVGQEITHAFALEQVVARIEGRVLWASGQPAPGVGVYARAVGEWRPVDHTTTDEDGGFVLEAPRGGSYSLVTDHHTYTRLEAVPAPARDLELVLPLDGTLTIQLLDATTNLPARLDDAHEHDRWLGWRSDPGETFRSPGNSGIDVESSARVVVTAGVVELFVNLSSEGYEPQHLTNVLVPHEAGAPPLVVHLRPGAETALRFVDDATAEGRQPDDVVVYAVPVAKRGLIRTPLPGEQPNHRFAGGIQLRIEDPELAARQLRVFQDGRATARGLSPGRYVFMAFPGGTLFEPGGFDVPGPAAELDVRFRSPPDGADEH